MTVTGAEAIPTLVISHGAKTDVGLRREINEDSLIAEFPIYAVADGVGGHEAGDRASQAVVAELRHLAGLATAGTDELADALDRAQAAVEAISDGTVRGAGSTVTGVLVTPIAGRPHWGVFNVGDSRVYRLRAGVFQQLTVDHSVAQELLEEGTLSAEDFSSYEGKNVITRAVGAESSEPDYWVYPIVTGETLVLCSDGLSGEVDDETIARVVGAANDPQSAVEKLIELALAAGGRDNVSAIVVTVADGGAPSSIEESTVILAAGSEREPEPESEPDAESDTVQLPRRRGRNARG